MENPLDGTFLRYVSLVLIGERARELTQTLIPLSSSPFFTPIAFDDPRFMLHLRLTTTSSIGQLRLQAAHPYYQVTKAGYEVVFASPKGGKAPLDPSSRDAFKDDPESKEFLGDAEITKQIENTVKVRSVATNFAKVLPTDLLLFS